MTVERRRADGADVQVVGRCAGRVVKASRRGRRRRLRGGSRGTEPLNDDGHVGAIGHQHVQVDNGHGSEVRNGGAADVFDGYSEWAERSGRAIAELLDGIGPARVVVDDDIRLARMASSKAGENNVGRPLMLPTRWEGR